MEDNWDLNYQKIKESPVELIKMLPFMLSISNHSSPAAIGNEVNFQF